MPVTQSTTAIVTGAAGALGRAVASALAARGATVVITDRDEAVRELAEKLGPHVVAEVGDVADVDSAARAVGAALGRGGRIDVLINNAALAPWADISESADVALAMVDETWASNVRGTVVYAELVKQHMVTAGTGHIVNISTEHGHNCGWPSPIDHANIPHCPFRASPRGPFSPIPALWVYDMTKWALNGLTFNWARALRPHGIAVNNVCPGTFDSPDLREFVSEFAETLPDWDQVLLPVDVVAGVVLDLLDEQPRRSGDNVGLWCGHPAELPPPGPHALVL